MAPEVGAANGKTAILLSASILIGAIPMLCKLADDRLLSWVAVNALSLAAAFLHFYLHLHCLCRYGGDELCTRRAAPDIIGIAARFFPAWSCFTLVVHVQHAATPPEAANFDSPNRITISGVFIAAELIACLVVCVLLLSLYAALFFSEPDLASTRMVLRVTLEGVGVSIAGLGWAGEGWLDNVDPGWNESKYVPILAIGLMGLMVDMLYDLCDCVTSGSADEAIGVLRRRYGSHIFASLSNCCMLAFFYLHVPLYVWGYIKAVHPVLVIACAVLIFCSGISSLRGSGMGGEESAPLSSETFVATTRMALLEADGGVGETRFMLRELGAERDAILEAAPAATIVLSHPGSLPLYVGPPTN